MYSIIPIHWNIKSALAIPGRSRVGPALYVFSLLGPEGLLGPPEHDILSNTLWDATREILYLVKSKLEGEGRRLATIRGPHPLKELSHEIEMGCWWYVGIKHCLEMKL